MRQIGTLSLLAGLAISLPAGAQTVDFMLEECSGLAKQYFSEPGARTEMRYNGQRVDGTHTVGGGIFLEARKAYVACAWPKGDYTISEFFVDGENKTAFFTGGGTGSAASEPGTATEQVRFAQGASGTELSRSLTPGSSIRFVLGAREGQDLRVSVVQRNGPRTDFQIFNPDGTFLLDLIPADREYRGQLWQSGDHVVEVVNRGGSTADFTISIGIH
ncbi:hypothetical protein H0I76_07475 [Limibaculum sp. M0105]|uniref:Uncharacterized protein n=1 Tax=Thermohalobaculum xanthum TaxID=2753746 RepID=A0A8J7M6E3_9RHOB|nr:hypothetical protein [Thermohalobaculum xanthum]MBK0399025.1 hypothetical protein [Thermohalobaculum xanthum]